MTCNILLTSLSEMENDLPVRYYYAQKEFRRAYCDAVLDTEAGVKYMLDKYRIDEVIVIGGSSVSDETEAADKWKPVSLDSGRRLYSADKASLSTWALFQYRMSQYLDELTASQQEYHDLLPEDARGRLISFIREFLEKEPDLGERRLNRLFDLLAHDRQAFERFTDALFEAVPEARENQSLYMKWVKNYLYTELKPSERLSLPAANEKVRICFIPVGVMEKGGPLVDQMISLNQTITADADKVNLYIALGSDDAASSFVVFNMLDILVSTPGSNVHLQEICSVCSPHRNLAGEIRDDSDTFGVTELVHATRSFLNYGKADLIVKIWEKSGMQDARIAEMVYAMRQVDVGLSMCNIPEVEKGILHLRELFRGGNFWKDTGYYGMIFSMFAESIQADYGTLLEGDGSIPFIDLVKWAYRHQFYQQTLTLIETYAPDILVRTGIFYYCDDETRRNLITDIFAQIRLELKPYEYYKMDSIDYFFVKNYDRGRPRGGSRMDDPQRSFAAMRVRSLDNQDPSQITGFTACDSRETLENVLYAYYHVSEVRNKINHADAEFMADRRLVISQSDENPALAWMKESINFFVESYEKAMDEVRDKNPNIVFISADAVRSAASKLKNDRKHEHHD